MIQIYHKNPKGLPDGHERPWTLTYDPEHYDDDSIMHYRSRSFWKGGKGDSVAEFPIVVWKKGKKGYKPPKKVTDDNAEEIYAYGDGMMPSGSDAGAIRALYPWEED